MAAEMLYAVGMIRAEHFASLHANRIATQKKKKRRSMTIGSICPFVCFSCVSVSCDLYLLCSCVCLRGLDGVYSCFDLLEQECPSVATPPGFSPPCKRRI